MNDFLSIIEARIPELSFKQQVLFMALTCEKLLPNYAAFQKRENRGDLEVLEETLVILYQYLQDMPLSENELEAVYNRIIEAMPDGSSLETAWVDYATDTCTAMADAIEYLLSDEHGYVAGVANCALETVERFANNYDSPNSTDTQIASNVYVMREMERQTLVMNQLQGSEVDLPFIAAIRELNNASGPIIDLEKIRI